MSNFRIDSYVSGMIRYIRKGTHKKGIVIAVNSPTNPNHIIFGYSLCNFSAGDKYNQEEAINVAYGRALRWDEKRTHAMYSVADSVKKDMIKLICRAKSYYKQHTFSEWAMNALVEDDENSIKGYFVCDDADSKFFNQLKEYYTNPFPTREPDIHA